MKTGKYHSEHAVVVSVSLAVTLIVLLFAPDIKVMLFVAGTITLGLIAQGVRRRQQEGDTVRRALVRLTFFSPIVVLPIVYAVFQKHLFWPILGTLSAWILGYELLAKRYDQESK